VKYWLNAGFLGADQLIEVAQAAEQLGFDGIALPDHLFLPEQIESEYPYSESGDISWSIDAPWLDCWVAIAAMAQATQQLRFTTGVYIAPLRDVCSLAKSVGTAAVFAPGRVACGLGAGWLREEFDVVGQRFDTRGPRFDEMLEVLPLLWSGDVVEYHGAHIDLPPLRMRPAAPDVPIWIGGNTGPALRRAAGCDGWIGTYTDLDDVRRMIREVTVKREHIEASGQFTVTLAATPGASRDADALDELGVEALILPAAALAPATGAPAGTADVIAGIERFAERRMT
jgi:probable F420-dependent oxidoreductase